MSHRSGETEDTTIADLAVATELRPDQDRRARPAPSGSPSTTSCCASRRSSTTPRVYAGAGAFPRFASWRQPGGQAERLTSHARWSERERPATAYLAATRPSAGGAGDAYPHRADGRGSAPSAGRGGRRRHRPARPSARAGDRRASPLPAERAARWSRPSSCRSWSCWRSSCADRAVPLGSAARSRRCRTRWSSSEQSVADLQREQARWADPAYVEQQARERLHSSSGATGPTASSTRRPRRPKPPDRPSCASSPRPTRNAPWYGQAVAVDAARRRSPPRAWPPVPTSEHQRRRPRGGIAAARAGAARRARRSRTAAPAASRTWSRPSPRLPDGTPFPTLYYPTCPRLTGRVSTLESAGS